MIKTDAIEYCIRIVFEEDKAYTEFTKDVAFKQLTDLIRAAELADAERDSLRREGYELAKEVTKYGVMYCRAYEYNDAMKAKQEAQK